MSSRSRARGYAYAQEYWYGSEAPELYPEEEERRSGRSSHSRRGKYREEYRRDGRAVHTSAQTRSRRRPALMDRALIVFMAGVMVAMSAALMIYISLTAQVTSAVSEIASLESQLSTLKSDNDEQLNEVNSKINLDDIKYRAIADLGMTYADKDQIVTYSNDSGDYVRQVQQVGN